MRERLTEFDDSVEKYQRSERTGYDALDRSLRRHLFRLEPTVRKIFQTLDPKLADDLDLSDWAGEATARNLVQRALGILADQDEWAKNLTPDAPTLAADQLHAWVWGAARMLWESEHYRAAVDAAANAINAHTQTKIGRRNIYNDDLMRQAFTEKPKPGQRYLRLSGDPDDQTVSSRNRGLRLFGQACFAGIRNPAAHEHGQDWAQQIALEYLATLSVLARWIDECEVVIAD
jgi:hypothetical protein